MWNIFLSYNYLCLQDQGQYFYFQEFIHFKFSENCKIKTYIANFLNKRFTETTRHGIVSL